MSTLNVFLSSTSTDLWSYREVVYHAIERLDGFHCVRMEDFGARDINSRTFCEQRVAECQVFVGVIGHVHGSCPTDSEMSFTECEYEAAVRHQKPRLLFVTPDDFGVPANLIEPDKKRERQTAFRRRVDSERIRDSFDSPDALATKVVTALGNMEANVDALRSDAHLWGKHFDGMPRDLQQRAEAVVTETTRRILELAETRGILPELRALVCDGHRLVILFGTRIMLVFGSRTGAEERVDEWLRFSSDEAALNREFPLIFVQAGIDVGKAYPRGLIIPAKEMNTLDRGALSAGVERFVRWQMDEIERGPDP